MSADSVEALAEFRDKYKLNFKLAGDTSHKTLEAYGVWQEKNNYGKTSMGIVRTTYIISPEGTVKCVFLKVKVEGHVQEVMAALKA